MFLTWIIDVAAIFSMLCAILNISLDIAGKKGLNTYQLEGDVLTKKKYNFTKKYPTNVKEMVWTKNIDEICSVVLDKIDSKNEYVYDCILVEYSRNPFFLNLHRKEKDISFVYFVILKDEFRKYVEKHNIKYNIEVRSYRKGVSRDATCPTFKYEILFSMDRKFYPKMKLVDLIS